MVRRVRNKKKTTILGQNSYCLVARPSLGQGCWSEAAIRLLAGLPIACLALPLGGPGQWMGPAESGSHSPRRIAEGAGVGALQALDVAAQRQRACCKHGAPAARRRFFSRPRKYRVQHPWCPAVSVLDWDAEAGAAGATSSLSLALKPGSGRWDAPPY